MKKSTNNFLRTLQAVNAVLKKNQGKIESLAALVAVCTLFDQSLEEVEDLLKVAPSDPELATESKNLTRTALEVETLEMALALLAIANGNKNMELHRFSNTNESKLSHCKEQELVTYCKQLATEAKKHLEKLAGFNLKMENIQKLEQLTTEFNNQISVPRIKIGERKAANQNLEQAINKTMDILRDQLDIQMEVIKRSEPELYSEYKTARQVVSLGTRHKKDEDNKDK